MPLRSWATQLAAPPTRRPACPLPSWYMAPVAYPLMWSSGFRGSMRWALHSMVFQRVPRSQLAMSAIGGTAEIFARTSVRRAGPPSRAMLQQSIAGPAAPEFRTFQVCPKDLPLRSLARWACSVRGPVGYRRSQPRRAKAGGRSRCRLACRTDLPHAGGGSARRRASPAIPKDGPG